MDQSSDNNQSAVSRNEPCPCGSGKKYKRCHGVGAAPKLGVAKSPFPEGTPNPFEGVDPTMMANAAQMLQRLPKGQLQRLQALMQKAMSGKDVSAEAAEFESSLPLEFQTMLKGFQMPGMPEADPTAAALNAPASGSMTEPMTEEEARKIVEQAMSQGKISESVGTSLLGGASEQPTLAEPAPLSIPATPATPHPAGEQTSGISKFWRGLTGKNKG